MVCEKTQTDHSAIEKLKFVDYVKINGNAIDYKFGMLWMI